MESGVQVFKNGEFGQVRVIDNSGKALCCGVDIATALGYAKPWNAITAHCRYALKRGVPHPQAPAVTLTMTSCSLMKLWRAWGETYPNLGHVTYDYIYKNHIF